MFEEKYIIENLSSTRVFVKNKSFWCGIKKETIAKIIEDLNAQEKIVSAAIPFKNIVNASDYLIIIHS